MASSSFRACAKHPSSQAQGSTATDGTTCTIEQEKAEVDASLCVLVAATPSSCLVKLEEDEEEEEDVGGGGEEEEREGSWELGRE